MYYLIPLPIILLAATVKIVAKYTDLKIINIVCNIVILIGVVFFIYFFLDYNNINLLEKVNNFFN